MSSRSWVVATAVLALGVAACADLVVAPTAAQRHARGALLDAQSSPQLLVCPSTTAQQTTGVVGLLGGVLSLGGTQIDIPAGAVLGPTLFQIVVPQSQYMEVEIHAVGLTTFLFHKPVDITIDYSRCGDDAIPSGAALQGVYIDTDTKSVLQQMGGVNDSVHHAISFQSGHLSGYAVAY
jgi:hypothetical protein